MKILLSPTGRRIVGTAEQMLTTRGINVTGRNADGSIAFEYNDVHVDHAETETHRTDSRGRLLYTDDEGRDWPEDKIQLVDEPDGP